MRGTISRAGATSSASPGSTNARCMSTTTRAVRPGSSRMLCSNASRRPTLGCLSADRSPRTAGPQPRDVLRLALWRRPPGPPAGCEGLSQNELVRYHGPTEGQPLRYNGPTEGQPLRYHGPTEGQPLRYHGPTEGQPSRYHGPTEGQPLRYHGPTEGQPLRYHGPTENAFGMWRMALTAPSSLKITETTSNRHGVCRM